MPASSLVSIASALCRRDDFRRAALLVVAVFAAYCNIWSAPFVLDDHLSILRNPTIHRLGWEALVPPRGFGFTVEGRPVLNLSLAFNYAWTGPAVWSYHLVNVAIHALAALVLFGVARRALARARCPGPDAVGFAAASLWALHPLQTGSVSYVVQRTESLMGLFFLLTLYAVLRGAESDRPARWQALACVACALGMATKEVMVVAPVIVLLFDRTLLAGSFREAWLRRRALYCGLATTWLLLAWLVLGSGSRGGTIGAAAGISPWDYALCQARGVVHYLSLALWPVRLIFDYGTDRVSLAEAAPFVAIDLVLLSLTGIALWRRSPVGLLGAWFFLILAPTSSVVGGTRQMLAEHRLYLSLAAVAVALAGTAFIVLGRRAWVLCATAAVALALTTAQRNVDYRSELALHGDTVAKRPGNIYARINYGNALLVAGRAAEAVGQFEAATRLRPGFHLALSNLAGAYHQAGRSADAADAARAALAAKPDHAEARFNLAAALLQLGRPVEAITHYETAIRLKPDYAEACNGLGAALAAAGRSAEAIARLQDAVRLRPGFAEAHYNLATALVQTGDAPAAEPHYLAAIQHRPDYADAYFNLGTTLLQRGRFAEAARHLDTAARLRPGHAGSQSNLGLALMQLGNLDQAKARFEAALRIDANFADAHCNLAVVLARGGRSADAIGHLEAALRANPDHAFARETLAKLRATPPP
ncbi:MAG: tetratricopeptide repeat protein [Verrucomicrobia bacterium]|nr:tetratricopeptide repeat protein [Verrucomicrobiota bacterium]